MKFDRDIVEGKLLNIHEALAQIERIAQQRGVYQEVDVDDLHVLHLQRAIQATIDVANHLIAVNRWEAPKTSGDAFVVLARHDVMPDPLVNTLKAMVGFRNIAVHRYGELDIEIVRNIVAQHLGDLSDFIAAIRSGISASRQEEE